MSSTGIESDPAKRKAIAAEMNLSVLKRSDAHVRRVLSSATHVAMYELFEARDKTEWRRCDIEGSLFVVERDTTNGAARGGQFRIVIINRKSLTNYYDDLLVGNEDIELNNQTIMYRNSKGDTVGIWFYQLDEAKHIFQLINQITHGQFATDRDKGGGDEGSGGSSGGGGGGGGVNGGSGGSGARAALIGSAVLMAQRNGELGGGDVDKMNRQGTPLSRDDFRAVLQRLLTDRKLFDGVYSHYLNMQRGGGNK